MRNAVGAVRNEGGSGYLEFVITLPLLLLVFFGIANLGKFLSISTGIGNTAYNVALVATDVPLYSAYGGMSARRDVLFGRMHERKDISSINITSWTPNESDGSVSVTVHGELKKTFENGIFDLINKTQGLEVRVPILNRRSAITDGTPQNETVYGCGALLPNGALTASCNAGTDSPPPPPPNYGDPYNNNNNYNPCNTSSNNQQQNQQTLNALGEPDVSRAVAYEQSPCGGDSSYSTCGGLPCY